MSEPFVEVWEYEAYVPCETCGAEMVGPAIDVFGWACLYDPGPPTIEWWCPAHTDDAPAEAVLYPEQGWPRHEIMFWERPARLVDVQVPVS